MEEYELIQLAADLLPSLVVPGRTFQEAVKQAFRMADLFAKEIQNRRDGTVGETPEIK